MTVRIDAGWRVFQSAMKTSPADRLAWLLELLQLPEEDLYERWPDLSIEAGAFAFEQPQTAPVEISHDDLIALIQQVKAGVSGLAAGSEWRLEVPAVTKVFLPRLVKGRGGRLRISGYESHRAMTDFRTAFLAWVDDLISHVASARLRQCARPGCGRLFVRKKRGLYCSTRCSQVERNKRYYQSLSKKDRQAQRHDRYVATVERENPARAKLVRRRSKENA